jgi:hypothetical protein
MLINSASQLLTIAVYLQTAVELGQLGILKMALC